ncbi:Nuclease sbcCD subunit C [Chryseobacterium gleum]|uniref:Nuclease sbcCD subunit C n=2 Tax=Chryseobacterium gleum TaxID=250 RepID=A0A3S4M904_CHRGE|nr:SMC family ATPase [Chryseobacterium gleum]EFK37108.1 exonuclease SbcCD, C subunit [Chryseobacterium gleum ATCC 35910]QQY32371.1 SMC family ATPase [Chryseobacterium gleum]VEE10420.1 Nuclease sbcCD subunit C [Chryseobacterium gleum]
MIPVQLTIEGLYSYRERQTIDFRNLTEAGLFGIFGAVGSGKSSVLEAISFALYGETERLNMRDKRAYNMMNLKSNSSYIEFDFVNYENKLFRATRDFKRNSKKFEEVKPNAVTFYENIDGKWIPLEHSNAEAIIGLSYSNFKRTIIIPQGQFKEFLELGAAERTNMMKEIFNLQKFDLQNNVSALNVKNRSELDQLEGQLKGFEDINEEKIKIQKEELTEEQKKLSEANKKLEKISQTYQQLKNLKSDFESLQLNKEKFSKLSEEKPQMDALEAKAELYDHIFRIFNPLIIEKNKLSKEIADKRNEKEQQIKIWQETEKAFTVIKKKLAALEPQFKALEQSKIQENDMNLIVQILKFSEEIKTLNERTRKGSEKVKEVDLNKENIQKTIDELAVQIKTLKEQKLDSALLSEVGNWFIQQKNLKKIQQQQVEKVVQQQKQISEIGEELKPFGYHENYKDDFRIRKETLEAKRKELSLKLDHLKIQKELSRFAAELHDGENCPLCGSKEHPHIVEFHDVNIELQEIQENITTVEQELTAVQKQESEIEKILDRKKIFEEQLTSEQKTLLRIQKDIEHHILSFTWKQFSHDLEEEFEKKRSDSFTLEKKIEETERNIALEREALEKENKTLEKYKSALEAFRLEEVSKQEQINISRSGLKILDWNLYAQKTTSEIEDAYQKLVQSNKETEENYNKASEQEKILSPKLTEQKTIVSQTEKQITELEKEISANESAIAKALADQNFTEFKEVENILLQEINIQVVRTQIQNFKIEFEALKKFIGELELKLKGLSFDSNQFSLAEQQLTQAQNEQKQISDSVVTKAAEIERLEKEFVKKEELLKALAKLQKRSENLKVMMNLFKGAGFVQYVSSIYLRQLCDHANVRFHRMTRNQLSLQLNENNDFEIIDYLNEGKSRSVKTLSGGQAFQVSLSLALALAESVQANAQADKNFFFIDEGFGTQDTESVNIVFETLTNLMKENRIVGIISHVEELKEKIPTALNIIKDEERGSIIEII